MFCANPGTAVGTGPAPGTSHRPSSTLALVSATTLLEPLGIGGTYQDMMATLIQIVIALIVAGFILWAVRLILGLIPMDAWIKQVVDVILIIAVVAIVLFYVLIPLLKMLPGALHL